MARRVHQRGRFGRKASATLRSLYPIVLGLGGWFLGVLIVITTMPGVPLDDELLAILSVGVPVGLGHLLGLGAARPVGPTQDAPASSRQLAGALAGAWLGLPRDGASSLALVTAIVGAIAGANLTLILLDTTLERPARRGAAVDARPSASSSLTV